MRPKIRLRLLSDEEEKAIRKLANSQNAATKLVKRSKILVELLDNEGLTATEAGVRVGFSTAIGAIWVRRFNEGGIEGLQDRPRPGRQRTHDEKVRSQLVSLALQKPRTLEYPFELWTLERLQKAFEARNSVHLAPSTILNWMAAEGFSWKRQQSWFAEVEKHDPHFVEKRGPLSVAISTPNQTIG
jgi:transposase